MSTKYYKISSSNKDSSFDEIYKQTDKYLYLMYKTINKNKMKIQWWFVFAYHDLSHFLAYNPNKTVVEISEHEVYSDCFLQNL